MEYCTHTKFRGMNTSRIPQIQHLHNCIFKDHWPDFVNDYVNRQGLNFRGMHIIFQKSKIYVPQKFTEAQYTIIKIAA